MRRSGQGQKKVTWRGPPGEVNCPLDDSARGHKREPNQTDPSVLVLLSQRSNRKTKSEAWTEGHQSITVRSTWTGEETRTGGKSRDHKKNRPKCPTRFPAPGPLLLGEVCFYLCCLCNEPDVGFPSLHPVLQFFDEQRQQIQNYWMVTYVLRLSVRLN